MANMFSRLSLLGKGVGFRKGFTLLALGLNRTSISVSSAYVHRNMKVRPFALPAATHQVPSRLSMSYSPKLGYMQEIKPAFKDVASAELPGTFPDKFVKTLEEADLIVSVSGREALREILWGIPPMPLTLTTQGLVLERLRRVNRGLPTNTEKKDAQNGEEEIRHTANNFFLQLLETKSFEYAIGVAIKQSPGLLGGSYLYQIIIELVRAGLLLNTSTRSHIQHEPVGSGPLSSREIENAQFGANGERGQVSLNTGIITHIIEHPFGQFSPFLTSLLQHNDAATLEGNIYEYMWSRKTIRSGRTPALARTTLLEKGVEVISASDMNMKGVADKCHELLAKKAGRMKLFSPKGEEVWGKLREMNLDLYFTVQAHLHGRSFVTSDKKFVEEWRGVFKGHGIHAYALDQKKIFRGMRRGV